MTNNNIFPKLSNSKIRSLLEKKEVEDLHTIDLIEDFLKEKRGHVFKMPKPGSPVILQISGGIDSATLAHLLMEKYKLVIYPIFINRGQGRIKQEEKSVDFFVQYFSQKFPGQFKPVFKMSAKIPPWEIRSTIIKYANELKFPDTKLEQKWGIPAYASLLASYSLQYGFYLEQKEGVIVRNIFCAALESDAAHMVHHSFTGMRSVTFNLCCQTKDYDWHFTSPFIEKELGMYYGKNEVVRWADKYNLPVHRTWSCYGKARFHCGECGPCLTRTNAYSDTKIQDKTIYSSNIDGRRQYIKFLILDIMSDILDFFSRPK